MRALLLVGIYCLVFSTKSFAGQIRTVHMNADKMKTVNLKIGQSTVLRFTDKPKKVVIGNQNYYSVEFIENDVTIQPLGEVKSNLFVYTAHHVYGFIMNPRSYGAYDDIVKVRWASSGIVLKQRPRKKNFSVKKLGQSLKVNKLIVQLQKMLINKEKGLHVIEFAVTNNNLKMLREKEIEVFLTRSNKRLSIQEFAMAKDSVLPFKAERGRLLVKLEKKQGFTFNVKYKDKQKGVIVSRWSL